MITLYLLLSKKHQLSVPHKLYFSYVYSFDQRPIISPEDWIVRWCPMCRLLKTSTVLTSSGDSGYSYTFAQYTHLWTVCTWFGITRDWTNDKILAGFVDLVENTDILIEFDIIFVNESNKIRYSYLFLLPSRTSSNGDSGVGLDFLLG